MNQPWARLALGVAAAVMTATTVACVNASKSSNPLSPEVAGPIAGVSISAPGVIIPSAGAQIDTTTQPIMLRLRNATTTGVRPLSYLVEVATDSGFANKVFARDDVPLDASGQTNLQIAPLAPERSYFWRARAADGANSGPFTTATFSVFTPVLFSAPSLIQPINDTTTSSNLPKFIVGNAAHSGPVGVIGYYTEVSDSSSFGKIVATYAVAEAADQTSWTAPGTLAAGQYFWRTRAYDPTHNGPFSAVASFHTPAAAPPTGGGGGGGAGGADMVSVILAAAKGIPASSSNMQAVMNNLIAKGYQASILDRGGFPSDHKVWINGAGWSIVSADCDASGNCSNVRWDPYIQVPYDGSGWSSCGIPKSLGGGCPPWA